MAKKLDKNTGIKKQSRGEKILIWTLFALLLIYAITMISMLGWGAFNSLKSDGDFRRGNDGKHNMLGFPVLDSNMRFNSIEAFFKLDNYKKFFSEFRIDDKGNKETYMIFFGTKEVTTSVNAGFAEMLGNSMLFAFGNALVSVLVRAVMGYMCAKYAYKFSSILYVTMIVVLALPIVGAYPAEIALLRDLGLYNNWIGNYIQKCSFTGLYFLVFYEYFKSVPNTYRDAAEIDGASQWRIMTEIYLPLALPTIGSVFVANHFTHNAGALHEEIEREASKIGFLVSYDGMAVEF